MKDKRANKTQMITKSGTSIENVPEDIVGIIAQTIRSWSKIEGLASDDERTEARFNMSSALFRIAFVSKTSYRLWQPALMEDVTLTFFSFLAFFRILSTNRQSPKWVRSLTMGLCPDSIPHERISWESQALLSMSSLPPNKPAERRMKNAMDRTLDGIYIKLEDIQTLIIRDTSLSFDFRQKVNGIIVPKRFLTNSLKKLYLPLPDTPGESIATKTLSARNAVWLMLYIKNLRTAHLGFAISNVDSDFLSEHSDYFKEMSSVTELSIAFTFIWRGDDKKTWWGLEEEKEWEAGNKKTMAALNFLKVTRSLTYLEIFHRGGSRNPDDKSVLQVSCLKSLTRSFSSLRHLRLLGIGLVNIKDPLGTHYSMFKNLRIFSMHLTALLHLKHLKELELPETLEIIALPLFEVKDEDPVEEHFQELDFLCKVIHDRDLPNLRQVIVPQLPNASDGKYITDRAEKKVWLGFMIQLEQFLGMSRPKVEFKRLGPGDIVGDPSKGETGISVHRWLSE